MTMTHAKLANMLKPVQSEHPDLVFQKYSLWLTPVHHCGPRIVLDMLRSRVAVQIRPLVSVLCSPNDGLQFAHAEVVATPAGKGVWRLESEEDFAAVRAAIIDPALDKLRRYAGLEGALEWYRQNQRTIDDINQEVAVLHAALGTDPSDREFTQSLDKWPSWRRQSEKKLLTQAVHERDWPKVAVLLREWEQATVTMFKLDNIWQPMPFPCESKIK